MAVKLQHQEAVGVYRTRLVNPHGSGRLFQISLKCWMKQFSLRWPSCNPEDCSGTSASGLGLSVRVAELALYPALLGGTSTSFQCAHTAPAHVAEYESLSPPDPRPLPPCLHDFLLLSFWSEGLNKVAEDNLIQALTIPPGSISGRWGGVLVST